MDLVTQYLRAVAALLPRDQREDITTELRDIILSRIEAREESLGRALTSDEIEEELRVVGHPILVAARYRDEPQHLVGPALYPYWMFAVKIAIAIQAFAGLISVVVRTLRGQDFGQAFGQALGQGIVGALTLVGVATAAAWLIERQKIHVAYLDRWKVRELHVLEYAGWGLTDLWEYLGQGQAKRPANAKTAGEARLSAKARRHRLSPIGHGIGLVVWGGILVLWWTGVIRLGITDNSTDLRQVGIDLGLLTSPTFSDLHRILFWPVLAYGGAMIGQGALILVYPRTVWLRGLLNILMGAALLAICIWLWTASPIASAIRVESVADLVLKVKLAYRGGPPVTLTPFLTIWLAGAAFGALCQMVKGLWEMLVLSRARETEILSPA